MSDAPRVFLSYAHADAQQVRNIYDRLERAGFAPWLDDKDILPGEKWLPAIREAIRESTFFLACMSPNSIARRGVLQREIRVALDESEELFDDDVFIIPVWIGRRPIPDDLPKKLAERQWLVLSDSEGWDKLIRSLRKQLKRLGRSESFVVADAPASADMADPKYAFPAHEFVEELKAALEEDDRQAAESQIDDLVEYLGWADEAFPPRESNRILEHLRRKSWLHPRRSVAEALVQSGQKGATTRIHYAECLMEEGAVAGALGVLEALRPETTEDPTEHAQVMMLYATTRARQYIKAEVKSGNRMRAVLKDALRSYLDVYKSDSKRHTGHGARAVSLICRAQRELTEPEDAPDPQQLAAEILTIVGDKHEIAGSLRMTEHRAAAESCLALGETDQAGEWVTRFVNHPRRDLFEVEAFRRDLTEVWELDPSSQGWESLVAPMERFLLLNRGADTSLPAPTGHDGVEPDVEGLEVVYGAQDEGHSLPWFQRAMDCARSVARIEDSTGAPLGTGFLVRGGDLRPGWGEEMVLLTAAYIVANDEVRATLPYQAVETENARVSFTRIDGDNGGDSIHRISEVLWSSPTEELDTSVLRLDPGIIDIPACPIGKRLPLADGHQRVYLIGHPKGGQLKISGDVLVDHEAPFVHYRAATEPGSGGSPVFNQKWDLIGLHHKGGQLPRLNGQTGTYRAKEGIWIRSIIEALSRSEP